MRQLPDGMAATFEGSTADARMQFNVWYGGQLVAQDLQVTGWKMGWDVTRQVRCQTSATVHDDSGALTPWDIDDILGTGGSILQATLTVAGMSLPVGYQPISAADPEETWRIVNGSTLWIPGGATIPIEAEDVTTDVIAYRFMAAESPAAGATCIGEIRRLLTGICDVRVDGAVVDAAVPSSIVYKEDRMAAVEDLVAALGALWKVTGDGQFHIHMESTTPVWTASGGTEGTLIKVKRKLTREGLYNAFVSRNTAPDGTELQGIALETSGPARFGGPLKYRTMYHAASFATSQPQVDADAATTRDNRRNKATAKLPVRVIFHPGVEVNDWVTVNMPMPDGSQSPISGKVLTVEWAGGSNVPVGMDLVLECNARDLRALSQKVRQTRWLTQ